MTADEREEILLKAKPILFNTDMIRAILDGRKTVTRRIVKPQPVVLNSLVIPPYKVGDVLYVRETWGISNFDIDEQAVYIVYKAGNEKENCQRIILPKDKFEHLYNNYSESEPDWHPSIHMPKEAARIFLRVTNVRVEKLQDITPEQIDAEGCKEYAYNAKTGELLPSKPTWFKIIWDSTIKKSDIDKYGWAANPYVWVIEFERID